MNHLLRGAAYTLTRKRINEEKLDVVRIRLKTDELLYFNLSSNPIASFSHEGKLYYFRECPEIRGFSDYFVAAIESFFESLAHLGICQEHFKQKTPIRTSFSDGEIRRFKEYVDVRKEDRGFLRALSSADTTARKVGFSIWEERGYDHEFFERFGLCGIDDELSDIAVYFLWCMRSAALGYRTLKIVRGRRYSFFNAVRAVSSKIVAEELGLAHMVTGARFCCLELEDEKTKFGVLSDAARGTRMLDTDIASGGALQRELLGLNALDVITQQPDHGPNNYNVYVEDGECFVCAFDNDNPWTFFPFPFVDGALSGCAPLVNGEGMVLRCCFDKQLALRIRGLDAKVLSKRLRPYLNPLQIRAVVWRARKLREAIDRTQAANGDFLLEPREFDKMTVQRELDGDYGVTYLTKALNARLETA